MDWQIAKHNVIAIHKDIKREDIENSVNTFLEQVKSSKRKVKIKRYKISICQCHTIFLWCLTSRLNLGWDKAPEKRRNTAVFRDFSSSIRRIFSSKPVFSLLGVQHSVVRIML